MTPTEELTTLRNKLVASQAMGAGYAGRCEALRKRIEEMEKRDGK